MGIVRTCGISDGNMRFVSKLDTITATVDGAKCQEILYCGSGLKAGMWI